MLPRLGLALLLTGAAISPGLAKDGPPPAIPACTTEQPRVIPACRRPPPPGTSAPFVPAASLCRLPNNVIAVQSCAILPGTATIPPGGMQFSANFGLFFRDSAAAPGRLHASPGQTRLCTGEDPRRNCDLRTYGAGAADAGAPGDPSAMGPPRQVVILEAEASLAEATSPLALIAPRILAQLGMTTCAQSTPSCSGGTRLPSRSFSLPLTVPAR